MTALLLLVALLAFVAVGTGVSLLRANHRPPIAGSIAAVIGQWVRTLAGRRALGAALVAGGALAILLILLFRP